jgi:hypothetical protein
VSLRDAVHDLRAFVETLRARPDIELRRATLGPPADAATLEQLAAAKLPRALIELFELVDGVHIEWRFIEPDGEGSMRIPSASQWTRFVGDDQSYMNFGDEYEALLLDEITPEGTTWLRRAAAAVAEAPFDIVFASAAEGRDGVIAAESIEAYLRSAIESGLVPYWPRCFKPNRYVSYATQERWVTRFRAPPVVPAAIRQGMRVHLTYFSEGGRGTVVEPLYEAPPSRVTEWCGTKFAQVQLDEGSLAWFPHGSIKPLDTTDNPDSYESLRDDGDDGARVGDDAAWTFDELVRAIGPLSHYSSGVPSNARLAAGLLATRSLASGVAFVLGMIALAERERFDLRKSIPITQRGREINPDELARHHWKYEPYGVALGLFAGLALLARRQSEREGIPGRALLDAALVSELSGIAAAKPLVEACSSDAPLVGLRFYQDPDSAAQLGLPADAIVLLGGGY